MTEPKKPLPSAFEIESALRTLSGDFNTEARGHEKAALKANTAKQLLIDAATALAESVKETKALQSKINTLQAISSETLSALKDQDITFLIDRSGQAGYHTHRFLETISEFLQITGAKATAATFATNHPPVPVNDLNDRNYVGYHHSLLLMPAVQFMHNWSFPTDKKKSFVILSDSDMYKNIEDTDSAAFSMMNLLKTHKNVSIDFVCIPRAYTDGKPGSLENWAKQIQASFPNQVGIHTVDVEKPWGATLVSVANARVNTKKKKPAAKPAP